MFTDAKVKAELKKRNIELSSANSINWGRLAPQIAYYISSYIDLVSSEEISDGDKINFVVPTGNFGDILAGYYAYKMGLPINKLIVASNKNKILSDFFHEGVYDVKRDFYKTASPSMDILISSNLERLIFEAAGRNDKEVVKLYDDLKENKKFVFDVSKIDEVFASGWADEEETADAIFETAEEYGYTTDTHTAVAMSVYYDYIDETADETVTVVLSTANPYKFPLFVYNSVTGKNKKLDAFKAAELLEAEIEIDRPDGLKNLKDKKVLHDKVVEKREIENEVLKFAEK